MAPANQPTDTTPKTRVPRANRQRRRHTQAIISPADLRARIASLGINISEAARRIGVDRPTMGGYLNGTAIVPLKSWLALDRERVLHELETELARARGTRGWISKRAITKILDQSRMFEFAPPPPGKPKRQSPTKKPAKVAPEPVVDVPLTGPERRARILAMAQPDPALAWRTQSRLGSDGRIRPPLADEVD